MRQTGVAVVGDRLVRRHSRGGIRAEACAANPLVKSLDIAETRPDRLQEVAKLTGRAEGDRRLS